MIEIVWQYDPAVQKQEPIPASASEARGLLEDGNRAFAELVANKDEGHNAQRVIKIFPEDLGISDTPGTAPKQAPSSTPRKTSITSGLCRLMKMSKSAIRER